MSSLRSALNSLASSFTDSVLEAIRAASLDELLAANGRQAARGGTTAGNPKRPTRAVRGAKTSASGRLRRRSDEEIAALLDRVVGAIRKHRDGMRAEQIRETLGLQAKEMPRILKAGLAARKLKAKGRKRATTYFAV